MNEFATSAQEEGFEDPVESESKELWEQFETEDFEFGARKGRAGGRKQRKSDSLTSETAREGDVKNAREKRKDEARGRINKVVSGFGNFRTPEAEEDFINDYIKWLEDSWKLSYLIQDPEHELEYKYVRSGAGAGGQNLNKVSSAAVCIHRKTNIYARNEETPDQHRNKANATAEVEKLLEKHLKDWKTLVTSPDEVTPALIKGMLAEKN